MISHVLVKQLNKHVLPTYMAWAHPKHPAVIQLGASMAHKGTFAMGEGGDRSDHPDSEAAMWKPLTTTQEKGCGVPSRARHCCRPSTRVLSLRGRCHCGRQTCPSVIYYGSCGCMAGGGVTPGGGGGRGVTQGGRGSGVTLRGWANRDWDTEGFFGGASTGEGQCLVEDTLLDAQVWRTKHCSH
jgi:hypothetical protein